MINLDEWVVKYVFNQAAYETHPSKGDFEHDEGNH